MKRLKYIFLIIISIDLAGCATVARGSNVDMVIDTQPAGAVVTTDLETKQSRKLRKENPDSPASYYGCPATPCEFEMSRKAEFIMTIATPGYEAVEIGVDHSRHKESMNANLAGSAGVGVATAAGVGALGASLASAGYITTSAAVAGTAIAAATVAGGVGLLSIGVDSATGALMNLNPNPVFLVLPPKGKDFEKDPKVALIRRKRTETPEEKRARKLEEKRLKKLEKSKKEKS